MFVPPPTIVELKFKLILSDHSWDYSDGTLLHHMHHLQNLQKEGKIGLVGLTNTDAAHLGLLINSGFRIATNQVSCSVIDQRVVKGRLFKVCQEHNVGILAYGTLLGGFIGKKWLGASEPTDETALNWSLRKYLRFITPLVVGISSRECCKHLPRFLEGVEFPFRQ